MLVVRRTKHERIGRRVPRGKRLNVLARAHCTLLPDEPPLVAEASEETRPTPTQTTVEIAPWVRARTVLCDEHTQICLHLRPGTQLVLRVAPSRRLGPLANVNTKSNAWARAARRNHVRARKSEVKAGGGYGHKRAMVVVAVAETPMNVATITRGVLVPCRNGVVAEGARVKQQSGQGRRGAGSARSAGQSDCAGSKRLSFGRVIEHVANKAAQAALQITLRDWRLKPQTRKLPR